MSNEHKQTEADAVLRDSAGSCQECSLWEPERKYRRDMANMGYCPMFDKRTRFDHGNSCTAFRSVQRQR